MNGGWSGQIELGELGEQDEADVHADGHRVITEVQALPG
jgi:hypothetical protein